jgi:hypothetical protein
MAKLIGKTHVSLLPYLKEFEENKILLSKQIGKNKIFSLNLENKEVKELLSLSEKKKTLEILNKNPFIKKIYNEFTPVNPYGCLILFGNYVSETEIRENIISLLYIGEINENEKKKIKEFGNIYGKKINLLSGTLEQFKHQLLKQSSLIKEVIKNHIILYNHDIFINEIWRFYQEMKKRSSFISI